MKFFRLLSNWGSFILLTLMPLACSTQLSDGIIAPKLALLWVGLALLCSGVGLYHLAKGEFHWSPRPVVISGAAFLGWYAFCCLGNGLPTRAVPGLLNTVVYLVLLFVWSATLRREDIEKYAGWCALTAFIIGSYAHLQRLTLANIYIGKVHIGDFMGWQPAHLAFERTIATLGNPNYFASYLVGLLPLALAWVITRPKTWHKYLGLFFWISSSIAMILTQTRSAWLGALVAVPVWLVIAHRATPVPQRRKFWLTMVSVIALVLIGAWGIFGWQKQLHPQLDLTNRVVNFADKKDLSVQARLYFWKSALRSASHSPVLGLGSGGHVVRAMQDRDLEPVGLRHPVRQMENVHSQPLQVLAESGWVGLILLAASWIMFIDALFRQRQLLAAGMLSSYVALWVSQAFICAVPPTEVLCIFLIAGAGLYPRHPQPENEAAESVPDTSDTVPHSTDTISDTADTVPDTNDNISDTNNADNVTADIDNITSDDGISEPAVDWHRLFFPVLVSVCVIGFTSVAAFLSVRCEYDLCRGEYLREDGQIYILHHREFDKGRTAFVEAQEYYMRAIEEAPIWRQAYIYRSLGNLVMDMYTLLSGNEDAALYQSAQDCFESSLSFEDEDPFTYVCMANLAHLRPNNGEATQQYMDKALALDPRNPQYINHKAQLLLADGFYVAARDLAVEGVNICPISPNLWHTLACAYRFLGDNKESEQAIEALIKLDPNATSEADNIRKLKPAK